MPLRVANAAGFLGDWIDAPRRLVERAGVDYLTLEYLAELTLSILARAREKDPQAGYATDLVDVVRSLGPALHEQPQLKLVSNGGGMNPAACARAMARVLVEHQLPQCRIGVVTGDDLLPRLAEIRAAACDFAHVDTGAEPPWERMVSANAYLGAQPIAQALANGARIVVTGRVADASLTVGPAMHCFGTSWDDWNRLAGYSVAGHVIECGAQATGGYSVDWQALDLSDVGYPIVELEADGSCVITKPVGSGGVVNRRTVAEQLVYEIGDPRRYITPDVVCDFTSVTLTDQGHDRVCVSTAVGTPRPDQLKASLAYRDGFFASGQLLVYGSDCIPKAEACAAIIERRLELAGMRPERLHTELLGRGTGVPGSRTTAQPAETVLRITAHDSRREVVERFTREFAPLITSGPAGLAGYAAGRPTVRPVYSYWPALVPRELIQPAVEVRTSQEWLA
jgi:hypothetical protein